MRLSDRNKTDRLSVHKPDQLRAAFASYLVTRPYNYHPVPFEGFTRFEVMDFSISRNVPYNELRAALPDDLDRWADKIMQAVNSL